MKTSKALLTLLKALTLFLCMFGNVSILCMKILMQSHLKKFFEQDYVPIKTFYESVVMNGSDLGEKPRLSLRDSSQISFLILSEFKRIN